MKYTRSAGTSLGIAILLSGCNPAGNPMVDMCQKITQNLVGTIETWEEPKVTEGRQFATTELSYQAASGQNGVAVCEHPKEQETYRTAPRSMTINGETIGQRDLMAASFGATKQIAKDTAEHTKEKSIELAQEASEKAKDLADDAKVLAEEAKVKADELAAKAETMAGEAKEKAAVLAEEARIKAKDLASQASELSAVATEKARAAALEATKAVQDKLEN